MRLQTTIRLSLALLVASAPAIAKEAQPGQHHPAPNLKAKPAKAEATAKGTVKRRRTSGRVTARAETRAEPRHEARAEGAALQHTAQLPPPDRYLGPMQVVGRREIGSAAWYGGRHLGQRTASGERLDAVHATAAHRSLPLNTMVRVTNLTNGRSVIATINDRGPVSRSLLIDVSPRAAEELDMMHSGIATVSIEPVAPAQNRPAQ
jgi:rare lipoprotein A